MVYKMRVGQGGREGGLRQEFVGVLLGGGGGRWSSSQRENATKHSTVLRNV